MKILSHLLKSKLPVIVSHIHTHTHTHTHIHTRLECLGKRKTFFPLFPHPNPTYRCQGNQMMRQADRKSPRLSIRHLLFIFIYFHYVFKLTILFHFVSFFISNFHLLFTLHFFLYFPLWQFFFLFIFDFIHFFYLSRFFFFFLFFF